MACDSTTSKTSCGRLDPGLVDDPLGAGQADLRPVDRRRVEVDEQVVVPEPGRGAGDRGLAADPVQPVQPAGLLGDEEQVSPADLAAVDDAAQQRLVGDDGPVGQRHDRLVDRPELRLGEDADLDGHAAAGQFDGEAWARSAAGRSAAAPSPGGSVTTRSASVSAAVSSRARTLEQPVQPAAAAVVEDVEQLRGRSRRSGPAPWRCRATLGSTWPIEVASSARVAGPGISQFWRQPQTPPHVVPTPAG